MEDGRRWVGTGCTMRSTYEIERVANCLNRRPQSFWRRGLGAARGRGGRDLGRRGFAAVSGRGGRGLGRRGLVATGGGVLGRRGLGAARACLVVEVTRTTKKTISS